jgi:hypothetical protein
VEIPTLTNLAFVYIERTSNKNLRPDDASNVYAAFGGGYLDFNALIDQNNSINIYYSRPMA